MAVVKLVCCLVHSGKIVRVLGFRAALGVCICLPWSPVFSQDADNKVDPEKSVIAQTDGSSKSSGDDNGIGDTQEQPSAANAESDAKESSTKNQSGSSEKITESPKKEAKEPVRPKFNIWEFQVKGNSLLEIMDIERVLYPFLGLRKTIDDVEAARLALEKYYKERGYPTVIVNIPQQKIKKGAIKLDVIEGKVSRFRVSGSRYFSISGIKESLPSLTPGKVFDVSLAREEIKKLNSVSSDLSATPILKQGSEQGTLEVDLQVKDKRPVHGFVAVNNQHSAATTELRSIASLNYSNLWQKFHTFSLFYQISPEDTEEVNVFSATYGLPINNRRDSLSFNIVQSDSNVFSELGDGTNSNVVGQGQVYGIQYISRLPALDGYFHSANFGFEYKDSKDDVFVGTAIVPDDTTPIDYAHLRLGYSGTFNNRRSITRFSLSGTQGINALNDQQEFLEKRLVTDQDSAIPNYFYLDGNLSQTFKYKGWQFSGSVRGRYTEDLLISNEQFSIGGVSTVRGYFESMHLGDRGYAGKLELRTPNVFSRYRWSNHWFKLQFFAFRDTAEAGITIAAPDQQDEFKLSSHGIGLEFVFARHLTGAAQWARTLEDSFTVAFEPAPEGEDRIEIRTVNVEKGEERFHFELKYEF